MGYQIVFTILAVMAAGIFIYGLIRSLYLEFPDRQSRGKACDMMVNLLIIQTLLFAVGTMIYHLWKPG